ncbi:unnamed protein product [Urochloa humidicola]
MDYANWTPCAPGVRLAHVRAGVPRSDDIRRIERELEIFSLIAVQLDARTRLDTARVHHEAVRQLRVPHHELGVSRMSVATFLLKFGGQQQRNAHLRGTLRIAHVTLKLLPWARQVSAKDVPSKFNYRVRVCIEGVPEHARFPEAITGLFKPPAFIDDLDCDMIKPEEEECLRLWLWTSDPDGIATAGTLQMEEPVTLPEQGYAESLAELGMPWGAMRNGPAETLDYDVLIQVDKVLDYSPPSRSTVRRSIVSPISGHPDESLEEEWLVKFPFRW